MDPYDSHHASGRDRSPESSTPIYDRLLAEWRGAVEDPGARGEGREGATLPVTGGSSPGMDGVFVPHARTPDGRER
ncbi:hypothetical protein AB0D35_25230 [Streptomyces sp. NPDC048301]|uniref:hypothetical protein n=1 Tax=unclassified Streptomyces TaxID=2593676 RepID=UPI00342751AB